MIVNKSIEFDPERRYQKPGEMLLDLKLAAKRIETAAADEEETSPEAPNGEGEETDGKPRTLMVVESDVKMQDVFRQLFKKRGYRVLVTGDPNRAMHRLQEDPTAADLAIFSSGTIGEPAVAAFNEFASETATKDLPAVLLLGQRQSELAPAAASGDRRAIARMPLKARQLCELVRRLLAAG
jgi:serine/threonine-protein kinase